MAVHRNGDIYIMTKEGSFLGQISSPARIYRLNRRQWAGRQIEIAQAMEFVGEIDFPSPVLPSVGPAAVVTGLDIRPDGTHFLVLTYELAIEFALDVAGPQPMPLGQLIRGVHYVPIYVKVLPQQEAITYVADGGGFLYTTEFRYGDVDLIRCDCGE